MSFDPQSEVAHATREYTAYQNNGEAAARAFRARIARLEMIGAPARVVLERQLTSADAVTRNAAARVLSAMHAPEAAVMLAAAYRRRDRFVLDARALARLGREAPVDPDVLPALDEVRPFERAALARALFRRRNDRAEQLIDPIFGGFESVVAEAAIDGMATWGDPKWLRDVIARPPMTAPPSLPRELQPADVRPHAAYYLARAGDPDALATLIAWANTSARARAHAVLRLAWLAHPDGIAPTAKLLRSRGGEPLELALDAAEIYRSPLLSEALEAIATRRGEIAREAVEALDGIRGADASRRYAGGVPLTLAILAGELAERDEAPRTGAAHNLAAITGEDHGFDLDDDLAGNLTAIDAWRERARDPAPMGEGGWAFRGAPLAPPPPP